MFRRAGRARSQDQASVPASLPLRTHKQSESLQGQAGGKWQACRPALESFILVYIGFAGIQDVEPKFKPLKFKRRRCRPPEPDTANLCRHNIYDDKKQED